MISRSQTGIIVECQLAARFTEIRDKLLNCLHDGQVETRLADWVVPTDRGLPLVLLEWTFRQILATPFENLYCIPGVGQKRIESLIQLMHRVANSCASNSTCTSNSNVATPAITPRQDLDGSNSAEVDPFQLSETVWQNWRERIIQHRLENATLGRFAPSLQRLPRAIWGTPLAVYVNLTLAEIRSLRSHGQKRYSAVLDVFNSLQLVLGDSGSHLTARCRPTLIGNLEDWTREVIARERSVDDAEIRHSFIDPLVQQIASDGGDLLADLAEHHLGLHGPMESVSQAADRLSCARSHIYDLCDEIATILTVRWPEGAVLVERLSRIIAQCPQRCQKQFAAAQALFFPRSLDSRGLSSAPAHSAVTRLSSAPEAAPDISKEYDAPHTQLV